MVCERENSMKKQKIFQILFPLTAVLALGVATSLIAACAAETEVESITMPAEVEIQIPIQDWQAAADPNASQTPLVLAAESAPPIEIPTPILPRYAGVRMTDAEREELAAIVYLEAGNQCAEGQQAVVEVVLNRVISTDFPDTVHEVIHQRRQFSTAKNIALAKVGQAQYDVIDAALYGPSILPEDVVYFSRKGENDRVWGRIEDHVFCYGYVWDK